MRLTVRSPKNDRITIQAPSPAVDSLGQRVELWTDVCTVWAAAQPLRGSEAYAAGGLQSEAAVRFFIRHRDDVNGRQRVLWRGIAHNIIAEPADVDGGRQTLELTCSAGIREEAAA
jgi:SPP1 family predicted phage head-tail adaptor